MGGGGCFWPQTTQPTSSGGVTVVCESNPPAPSNGGPINRFLGQPAITDPLDGWRCSSQKRVMSRLIQVRQLKTNESGFVISAINKYMLGSRYPEGAKGLNTGCTSDAQVSAKHNKHIPGPIICTENPDSQLTQTSHHPTPKTLVQAPYPLPTYTTHAIPRHPRHPTPSHTTHATTTKTQTHVQHFPCSHRIGKAQTQLFNPLTPSPPTPPRAKHIHISHTPPTPLIPRTTLIHDTSAAIDTIPEPRIPPTCPALTTITPHPSPTPALPSTSHYHTLSAYTHATQTTVHASQSQQPPHLHMVPRQPHRQTKDDHMTIDTSQGHRPSSRSEGNLNILQVNIDGIKNKLDELKLLIHDTHTDIITIQEIKLIPKANTPKVYNFATVRTDRLYKAGGVLITFIRDNLTFTTTAIHSTINTHNTELQMVKVHINNTKHITIANMYIPPRYSTSMHNKTADTDIQHYIQYITNIPHSVLTRDVNAHSTLWHSYTDDHRGQRIADVISNSDHKTLNTNRVPNITLQQTSSPDITTVSNTL